MNETWMRFAPSSPDRRDRENSPCSRYADQIKAPRVPGRRTRFSRYFRVAASLPCDDTKEQLWVRGWFPRATRDTRTVSLTASRSASSPVTLSFHASPRTVLRCHWLSHRIKPGWGPSRLRLAPPEPAAAEQISHVIAGFWVQLNP